MCSRNLGSQTNISKWYTRIDKINICTLYEEFINIEIHFVEYNFVILYAEIEERPIWNANTK